MTLAAPPRLKQAGRLAVAEWRFAPQWSAFLEGNYDDFGDRDRTVSTHNFGLNGCDAAVASTPKRPQPLSWSA